MKQFLATYSGPLRLRNPQTFDQWHYPLSLVILPADQLTVRVEYDEGVFEGEVIEEITAEFVSYLTDF